VLLKYHEQPSSGSRVIPYGRTDRRDKHDKPAGHFS